MSSGRHAINMRVLKSMHQELIALSTQRKVSFHSLIVALLQAATKELITKEGEFWHFNRAEERMDPFVLELPKQKRSRKNLQATGVWVQYVPWELHRKLEELAHKDEVSVSRISCFLIVKFFCNEVEIRDAA